MSKLYINNLQIEGAGEVNGARHEYQGVISSTSLNTKYFRMSPKTLASITKQANENRIKVFQGHNTYRFPSGRSLSAYTRDEKSIAKFYIQSGIEQLATNDLIALMDEGTVDSLSIGFTGGEFKCDLCEEMMEPKYSWFSSYMEDSNGHYLGKLVKQNGKDIRVTAEVQGEINLKEFSIVGTGSDPSAKIIKKLQESLSDEELHIDSLAFIAEASNLNLHQFCNTLGVSDDEPYRILNTKSNKEKNMDPKLLEQENERLSKELAEVTEERDNLQEDTYTKEEYDSLNKEYVALKEEYDKFKEEHGETLEGSAHLAKQGELALEILREEYKNAFKISCGTSEPTDEELQNLDKSLEATKDVVELKSGIDRLLKKARDARSGGRKTQPAPAPVGAKQGMPKGYTGLFV